MSHKKIISFPFNSRILVASDDANWLANCKLPDVGSLAPGRHSPADSLGQGSFQQWGPQLFLAQLEQRQQPQLFERESQLQQWRIEPILEFVRLGGFQIVQFGKP